MEGLRTLGYLTRRESEIMDVLYKLGKATVADVLDRLPEKRSYSTVRAQLRVLEEKQQVRHEKQDLKYVYAPIVPREVARLLPFAMSRTFSSMAPRKISSRHLWPKAANDRNCPQGN